MDPITGRTPRRSPAGGGGALGTALLGTSGRPRLGDFGQELATPVGALVMRRARFVSPDDTVADAARFMREAKISSALVRSAPPGIPLGILTSGDLRDRVLAEELATTTSVSEVMTTPVRSCRPTPRCTRPCC